MPKQRKKEMIQCQYFRWKLGKRHGVYQADGRTGNRINLGRHSLATKDANEARDALRSLDEHMATQHGLIVQSTSPSSQQLTLPIKTGLNLYRSFFARPRVTGGVKSSSKKRYQVVLDKFIAFAEKRGVSDWNHVTEQLLYEYASWLEAEGYAPRTQYLELTTIKQCIKWLVQTRHLPADFKVDVKLKKTKGSDRYCWTVKEVTAMVNYCKSKQLLGWMVPILIALASTGLRISELTSLRWTDLDEHFERLSLTDESAQAHSNVNSVRRETKSGRSRSFPIHPDLRAVLKQMDQAKDGLIFHGPQGGRLKPDTLRTILVRDVLTPLAEQFPSLPGVVGFKDGRLHSFRHYFCSVCANSGVPELMVMDWLGHADSDMVRHYYHMNNHEAKRQMGQLSFIDNDCSMVLQATEVNQGAMAMKKTSS